MSSVEGQFLAGAAAERARQHAQAQQRETAAQQSERVDKDRVAFILELEPLLHRFRVAASGTETTQMGKGIVKNWRGVEKLIAVRGWRVSSQYPVGSEGIDAVWLVLDTEGGLWYTGGGKSRMSVYTLGPKTPTRPWDHIQAACERTIPETLGELAGHLGLSM